MKKTANDTQAMPNRTDASICTSGIPLSTLLEDHRHVVEVGEVGLEKRLADPVLTRVEDVVDAHVGGGDPAQRHRMLGEGIADLGPIPCCPCPQLNAGESGLNPDLHGMANGQLTVNPDRRNAFEAKEHGQ